MENVERSITRSDAWTADDDERLASLVLHHIKVGSTQLRAFEEAGNQLGRTAAACGYRWNGVVRKHYRAEIDAAKKERKSNQRNATMPQESASEGPLPMTVTSSDSMKDVIKFLQVFDDQYQNLRRQVSELSEERASLIGRIKDLETQISSVPETSNEISPAQLEEDSKTLFAIMERARKLLGTDSTSSHSETSD